MKTYLKDLTPEEIIRRLKNGEVPKSPLSREIIKLVDGVLFMKKEDGSIIVNPRFEITSDLYFETEEPFEIKETGFYRTRVGAKVYVNSIDENRKKVIGGVIEWADKYYYWDRNGVYCSGREDAKDIISKWEETLLPNITGKM